MGCSVSERTRERKGSPRTWEGSQQSAVALDVDGRNRESEERDGERNNHAAWRKGEVCVCVCVCTDGGKESECERRFRRIF